MRKVDGSSRVHGGLCDFGRHDREMGFNKAPIVFFVIYFGSIFKLDKLINAVKLYI